MDTPKFESTEGNLTSKINEELKELNNNCNSLVSQYNSGYSKLVDLVSNVKHKNNQLVENNRMLDSDYQKMGTLSSTLVNTNKGLNTQQSLSNTYSKNFNSSLTQPMTQQFNLSSNMNTKTMDKSGKFNKIVNLHELSNSKNTQNPMRFSDPLPNSLSHTPISTLSKNNRLDASFNSLVSNTKPINYTSNITEYNSLLGNSKAPMDDLTNNSIFNDSFKDDSFITIHQYNNTNKQSKSNNNVTDLSLSRSNIETDRKDKSQTLFSNRSKLDDYNNLVLSQTRQTDNKDKGSGSRSSNNLDHNLFSKNSLSIENTEREKVKKISASRLRDIQGDYLYHDPHSVQRIPKDDKENEILTKLNKLEQLADEYLNKKSSSEKDLEMRILQELTEMKNAKIRYESDLRNIENSVKRLNQLEESKYSKSGLSNEKPFIEFSNDKISSLANSHNKSPNNIPERDTRARQDLSRQLEDITLDNDKSHHSFQLNSEQIEQNIENISQPQISEDSSRNVVYEYSNQCIKHEINSSVASVDYNQNNQILINKDEVIEGLKTNKVEGKPKVPSHPVQVQKKKKKYPEIERKKLHIRLSSPNPRNISVNSNQSNSNLNSAKRNLSSDKRSESVKRSERRNCKHSHRRDDPVIGEYHQRYQIIKDKRTDIDKVLRIFASHLKHCPCLDTEINRVIK